MKSTKAPPRARLAWISPSAAPPGPAFVSALREAGYVFTDSEAEGAADIAIVDFRTKTVSAETTRRLSSLARRSSPSGAVVYLAAPSLDAARRGHLRRSGLVVFSLDDPAPLIAACRDELRLRARAEEGGERIKSLAAAGALDMSEPLGLRAPIRVLVAAAASPLALSIVNACRGAGYGVVGVLNAAQAMTALETGGFDCGVFAPEAASDPLRSLAGSLRRRLITPIVPALTVERDALSADPQTILAPHAYADLGPRVADAVRRARQRVWLNQFLTFAPGGAASDPYTPTASAPFFARHVARLSARADQIGRPISLVGVRIDADPLLRRPTAEVARPLEKAAEFINRVCRAEDMTARIGASTFAITLPGATGVDAARVAERIAGVLRSVMFDAPSTSGGPPTLFAASVAACAVEREPSCGVEETVARLLASLNAAAPSAAEGA